MTRRDREPKGSSLGDAVGPAGPDQGQVEVCLGELLAERGLTLTALAEEVGLTLANVSILKNGHARAIRFSTLAALCQALDCQPGDLLKWRPPPEN
jgi:putative transcriptional regulator